MLKKISLFTISLAAFFTFAIFSSSTDADQKTQENANQENLPQVIKAMDLNKDFSFAGEAMPSDNFDAKERLDVELSRNAYYHSNTLLNIKKTARFFPIIEEILAKNGVPDDFKYLAVAESGLLNVSSSASAKGFWQFRKLAGKEYGLEINDEVDERFHVEKATLAACKYLNWLHGKFGTWTDASAAYNVGPTAYKRQMKAQNESSFYDLNLNRETSKYVFRLIAIKEIMSQPEQFGFYIDPEEKYPPMDNYYQVEVAESIKNWGAFAHQHGISYRELKRFNPWLRDNHLTVIKNRYLVKIPRG